MLLAVSQSCQAQHSLPHVKCAGGNKACQQSPQIQRQAQAALVHCWRRQTTGTQATSSSSSSSSINSSTWYTASKSMDLNSSHSVRTTMAWAPLQAETASLHTVTFLGRLSLRGLLMGWSHWNLLMARSSNMSCSDTCTGYRF